MKKTIIKIAFAFLISLVSSLSFGQSIQDEIDKLNEVCANSLYHSSFTIDQDGVIVRTTNSTRNDYISFTFNIKDVKSIEYVTDGFHNVMIKLKPGKKSTALAKDNTKSESDMNIIAFKNKKDCDKAIEIFKRMTSLSK